MEGEGRILPLPLVRTNIHVHMHMSVVCLYVGNKFYTLSYQLNCNLLRLGLVHLAAFKSPNLRVISIMKTEIVKLGHLKMGKKKILNRG
jgi:hypothetical protein